MSQSGGSSLFTDREYLRHEQYRDTSNLDARATLHQRFSTNRYGWHTWVFDHIKVPSAGTLLELGCGSGELWRQNALRVPSDWRLVLSDLSAGMAKTTRHIWSEDLTPFLTGVIDAQHLPLIDDSVDAVIAGHILHHVRDVGQATREIRRVLKPSGVLYATAVGNDSMWELHEMVTGFDPDVQRDRILPWMAFTLETGSHLLAENFENTAVFRYSDALCVTEADPLVDYVASLFSGESSVATWCEEFRDYVACMIADRGSIHISKDSGLIAAW